MKYVEQKLYEKVIDFVTTCHDIPFHALSEWHYYIIIAIIITDTQKFKYHGAMEESSSDTRRVSVNWKTISDYVCVSKKMIFLLKWIVKKLMIFLHWFLKTYLVVLSLSLTHKLKNNSTLYIVFIFVKWQKYIWKPCQVYPAFR